MKKITLLAAVIIAASFASCKKNWNCECTSNTAGGDTFVVTSAKMKKKDAKTWCESGNDGSGYTCKIK